eukprot:GHVO01027246.1.p2 GENE.GHVO01027246.1~~GHVO01027246.1.p2  ORF type:complete len:268 (+),score=39.30 GHVO01027246.1:28-804(+)
MAEIDEKQQGESQITSKRKFVAYGIFEAELNEFLSRTLAEDGFAGVEVRPRGHTTEVIVRATRTREVLGENMRRGNELATLIQSRFGKSDVRILADRIENRGLCAMAQCESLRYKLDKGLAVRRACYGVLRHIMESGAKGCEVVVSGKLRGQRAKSMKFKDGYMIATGNPAKVYIDSATRTVKMKQGVLGVKVKIMLPQDKEGKIGPKMAMPDQVIVHAPKIVELPEVIAAPAVVQEEAPAAAVQAEPLQVEAYQMAL